METTTEIVKKLLSKWWWVILLCAGLEAANSEYGEYALLTFRDTQQFPLFGVGFLISMILNFVLPVVSIALLASLVQSSKKPRTLEFQPGLWLLIKENMRVYGWVFLNCLLLLIPGVIKYIRYSFVPFVVFFEPRYADDNVDALKYSSALSKNHFGKILGVIALAQLAPILPWLAFGDIRFRENMALASGNLIWLMLVEVMAFVLLYRMFLQAREATPVQQGL